MASTGSEGLDWLAHFEQFFLHIATPLAVVLDADGCREGWLQGEFYRYGRRHGPKLSTNTSTDSPQKKFDLLCGCPPMLAEIKIAGGNYYAKVKGMIADDVERLLQADHSFTKVMILVVDRKVTTTKLAKWLMQWEPAKFTRVLQRAVSDRGDSAGVGAVMRCPVRGLGELRRWSIERQAVRRYADTKQLGEGDSQWASRMRTSSCPTRPGRRSGPST